MGKPPSMDEGITQADIEVLIALNVMAAEQLRRIIAERLVRELRLQVQGMTNGADMADVSNELTTV